MKARLHRLGTVLAMTFVAFALLIVLQILMDLGKLAVGLQTLIPNAPAAEARIITRIISPALESNLELLPNNRLVHVVGHIHCDAGEQLRIDFIITQADRQANARGHTQDFCTGEVQTWAGRTAAAAPTPFAPGPAEVCAVATTRFRGKVTDTFSWCKPVTLVR